MIDKRHPFFQAVNTQKNTVYQRVEKVLIQLAVQKFQVQGAKKVQDRSVFMIRKSLNFLQRRSNWEIFNCQLMGGKQ
ncbi:hypothetical protein [Desulfonatronovibrio magnus]|uniref:hypothetical protein n=1 Tax=Desulfonatronovibrio magnus TaxID=698827 RepID=UPI0005EB5643|nr:hypothetical protein [Desulfonatronovibrio magnus]